MAGKKKDRLEKAKKAMPFFGGLLGKAEKGLKTRRAQLDEAIEGRGKKAPAKKRK